MKTCFTCQVEKPLEDFHRMTKSKDGRQHACKECNRAQRKAYYKTAHGKAKNIAQGKRSHVRNRNKVIEYLEEHPCVDCGEPDIVVLEFDHLDPKLKFDNISGMLSLSWAKIEAEIEKCDVVCANCHKRRTAQQFNWFKASTDRGLASR